MTVSLLFGKKYARTSIGGVTLDATLSENHFYTAKASTYPIEDGRVISDHIINENETVEIRGVVSDSPLSILSLFNRSIDAFNRLLEIRDRKERISLVTGIKVYTDMIITSMNVPIDLTTGQSLTFSITLQKIFIDRSTTFQRDINNPFDKNPVQIDREQVANASKYEYFGRDPDTSFKDQATSQYEAGIQDLRPIPPILTERIQNQAREIGG